MIKNRHRRIRILCLLFVMVMSISLHACSDEQSNPLDFWTGSYWYPGGNEPQLGWGFPGALIVINIYSEGEDCYAYVETAEGRYIPERIRTGVTAVVTGTEDRIDMHFKETEYPPVDPDLATPPNAWIIAFEWEDGNLYTEWDAWMGDGVQRVRGEFLCGEQ